MGIAVGVEYIAGVIMQAAGAGALYMDIGITLFLITVGAIVVIAGNTQGLQRQGISKAEAAAAAVKAEVAAKAAAKEEYEKASPRVQSLISIGAALLPAP